MKYLSRIAVFFGLIMLFALVATAQAATTENTKAAGKQISVPKQPRSIARYHYNHLWIDRTWFEYLTDEDGDGFYHHFRFAFDADTSHHSQALYAQVYLSDGADEWLIFESGTFFIHAQSGDDVYEITTSLHEGYPAQRYDLVLRLYNAADHQLLEEWTQLDDSNLANRYLEDAVRDTLYSSTPYIHHFDLSLQDDFDEDGYFSQLNFTIDVDAPHSSSDIRIGIEIFDDIEGWQSLYLSSEITITGSIEQDAQTFVVDLDSGYPPGLYPVRITVYESLSRAILATESLKHNLALESLNYESDNYGESRSSSSHGQGGALGLLLLPLLGLALWRQRI